MKKIVVFLSIMLGIMNVSATTFEIRRDDDVFRYGYISKKIHNKEAFMLSFDGQLDYDAWLIGNLAQLAEDEDDFNKSVIQKMILENVNPNYVVKMKDQYNNNVDTTKYESELLKKIEKFNKPLELDGTSYEINVNESLSLSGFLNRYAARDLGTSNFGDKVEVFGFKEVGKKEVYFDNYCIVNNGYVLASGYSYKPFKIYVNVLGYKVDFEIPDDSTFWFSAYDKNNNLVKNITIDKNNTKFYYGLNEKITLVNDEGIVYEKLDDIILEGKDEVITINPHLKKYTINFKTKASDIYKINEVDSFNDFTVYDASLKEVYRCNSDVCTATLDVGKYFIVDNVSSEKYYYGIYQNEDYVIKRYFLQGILSDKRIDRIKVNDNEIIVNNNHGIYYLDHYKEIRTLEVLIDNIWINLDLSLKDNYWLVKDLGLFYKLGEIKKDEVIIDENDNNVEDKDNSNNNVDDVDNKHEVIKDNDAVISIDVPNTNINLSELVYISKKYYW